MPPFGAIEIVVPRPHFQIATRRRSNSMDAIRPAAVAGMFYPAHPDQLSRELKVMLDRAAPPSRAELPKAVIVPHAGYVYSGDIAASVYRRLSAARDTIKRVVLLGPAHRVFVRGLALPASEGFATPLGTVKIDAAARESVLALPQICVDERAHAPEHSLEVQLPFLQTVLGDFMLLPLVVGDATPAEVAEVLERVWGGPETLIVISSDLSHYLPYAAARRLDRATADKILRGEHALVHDEACGATPVNGLLLAARHLGLEAELVDLRNSGDTAGDRSRVVGYAGFTFHPSASRGEVLLDVARGAIARGVGLDGPLASNAAWLTQHGASFVTLTRHGRLRGCIGSLEAHRPLGEDVAQNALAAAMRDPRFAPLSREEYPVIRVEVSELSAPERMDVRHEADALAHMQPGIDGIVFECGGRRATFLPQVWEQLPDPGEFMGQLKRKAGFPADFWSPAVRLSRYTVTKWREA
jgi:AmmeMemoRadiSam system protein B/AmmeMemoRadiSam system protein A